MRAGIAESKCSVFRWKGLGSGFVATGLLGGDRTAKVLRSPYSH